MVRGMARTKRNGVVEVASWQEHGTRPSKELPACAVLAADPPWKFGDALPGKTRGASKNYKTMTVEEICAFSLPRLADDALLFLWRVAAMPTEAIQVARAWGFEPKSEIVWVKTLPDPGDVVLHFGMGRYVRASHETCIIAARGRAVRLVHNHGVRSVFFAHVGEHSAKPDEFYRIVRRLVRHANRPGPRMVELFARGAPREGWETYGFEAAGSPSRPRR